MPKKPSKSKKSQPKLKDLKAKKNVKGGARGNTIGGARNNTVGGARNTTIGRFG